MLKILIVDDEPNILFGLRKLIDWKSIGYEEPALFTNPLDALDSIRCTDYDVLLTDIRMPEMTGLELMEEAKKSRDTIKIIVLSSYSDYEYMHKALLERAVNYLLKPVHEEELTETLRALTGPAAVSADPANRPNDSYSKIYDSLKTVFDESFDRLKAEMFEINREKIHAELVRLDRDIRRLCAFTPAKPIIIENYNHMLAELLKTMGTTLLLKKGTIDVNAVPSYDSMSEITEAAIDSIDQLIDGCISACTEKSGTLMDTVELYIQLNFNRPLTLASVSGRFFLSPSYFSATFSKERDPFLSYLNKIRLRHGAQLLTETDDTIAVIAGKIGYNSEKLFYKAFKSRFKCTPTQYRVNNTVQNSNQPE